MISNNIFGKHQFVHGETKTIDLGNSRLFIKREKEGWYFLTSGELNNEVPDYSKGEYFQTGKSNSMIIMPALPEKPIVFKGNQLKVLPAQKFTFFLKIPATLQFYYSKNQTENLLKEITPKQISNTWFGDPDSGEPALALGSEYFLIFDGIETSPFEMICPVSIINKSATLLEMQRLIIRTENLSVYKNNDKNVTSLVQLEFKGQDFLSSPDYIYSKIYDGEKQEILAKPRNISDKNPLKMHLHFIKNMYKID